MKLALPFPEALGLATAEKPLPAAIRSVHCVGETLHAEIDLQALATRSTALRLAAAAAGTVTVTARFLGHTEGVATFVVTAHARNLPAHKLLQYLLDPLDRAMRERGLPEGLLRIQPGAAGPLVLIDLRKAIQTRASGVTVTSLHLRDAVIHVDAAIGTVRLH